MRFANFSLLIALIAIMSLNINAQEDPEMKYIFSGNKKIKVSGFLGPIMEFSAIQKEFAFFMGGQGGLIFNQMVYFGGYGEGLTTRHYNENWDIDNLDDKGYYGNITFGHGGFVLGYLHKSSNPIHFGISSRLGWGTINTIPDKDIDHYYYTKDDTYKDHVFVAIPQIEVEFNFTKWFKVNAGIGYRIVAGIDKEIIYIGGDSKMVYDKKDFNKPQGTIMLCFGYFK